MKKIILALTFSALTSHIAFSEEVESELMEAPSDYIISLISICKDWAIEDEIIKIELDTFLLACVNDELRESDYSPLNTLPKEE